MPKKTYQEQMRNSYPNYPQIREIPKSMIKTWGEGRDVWIHPLELHELLNTIPQGKVMSAVEICEYFAKKHEVEIANPYVIGIFMNIVAHAIEEDETDETPWWRAIGSKNELKPKYPNAPEEQMALLEAEGFSFVRKGRKNVYWVVER